MMITNNRVIPVVIGVALIAAIGGVATFVGIFTTAEEPLSAPTMLVATQGTEVTHIRLEWEPVDQAQQYRIYRDGKLLATSRHPSYEDFDASAGDVPEAPQLSVARPLADRVEVHWAEPRVEEGISHSYRVRALGHDTVGKPSAPAMGWRAGPPISDYLIEVDQSPWKSVGNTTHYVDFDADGPSLHIGDVSLKAVGGDVGRLEIDAVQIRSGEPSHYRARAVNDLGVGPASNRVSGHTDADGPVKYRWEQAAGSDPDLFEALPNTNAPVFYTGYHTDDEMPPRFRVVVDAAGVEPAVAGSVSGIADRRSEGSYRGLMADRNLTDKEVCEMATDQECDCSPIADEDDKTDLRLCRSLPDGESFDGLSVTNLVLLASDEYWYAHPFATTTSYFSGGKAGGRIGPSFPGLTVTDRRDDVVMFGVEYSEVHYTVDCLNADQPGGDQPCGSREKLRCSTTTAVVVDTSVPDVRLLAMTDQEQSCHHHDDAAMEFQRKLRLGDNQNFFIDDQEFDLGGGPILFPLRDGMNTREHMVPLDQEVKLQDLSVF